ncbi:uncharacterized protein LOC113847527 isoform X2 [Abrus precatorius]|uniref:Uncharacterized protein LOC113847527 isoform X2 n=1 Tax=Abrus precatorius TaxID=3816 RepID=A0A8B8JPE9_ABRPR|nr:uncharacterized protein LOC113847527 isoform X2 [Abrus precatorius]
MCMKSYYHSREDKAESSLWIHKYKPTKAFEVCGNDEALNILGEWLHLWHEKRYQCRRESSDRDMSDMKDDEDDYNCSDGDYAPKYIDDKDSLQNVLLLTGPVGSGKSAAVYACAREQGFEVLELNTSDRRNGATVKQNFGDALESHGFRLMDQDHTASSHKKITKLPSAPALPNGKAAKEMNDDGVIELITISNDETHSPAGTSPRLHDQKIVYIGDNSIQTLILVEDVDILFPEDRGCIAAIQHIAKAAQGPIILTSNSKKPGLPDKFARLHVSFTLPSPDELLCHLYMVCVTEEVNIDPLLLEKFIESCDGDIRKTIMQLQFWFQSKKYRKDRKVQMVYGSLPFDLEACHQITPKILPWNYPSELSKLIEKEVAKSITIMEENSCLQGLVNKELDINERQNDFDVKCMRTDYLEAKAERIKRNTSLTDCSEFESEYNAISELSNCSRSPVTSSLKKGQKELMLRSSDSGEKDPNNGLCPDVHDESYKKRHSVESNSESPCKLQLNQSYISTSFCKLVGSGLDGSEEQCKYLETVHDVCLNESQKSLDLSCFTGSIFPPETANQNGIKTMSGSVSSGHLAYPVEVSLNNELTPFTHSDCHCLAKLPQNSDSLVNAEFPESSPKAAVQDFRDESTQTKTVYNGMDECSHVDMTLKSKFVESSPSMETDMVQNLWRKLRVCRTNFRQHANLEKLGVIQVVKLTSGLTNLISEADLLFSNHQQKQCGILEPPLSLSDEATFNWYDEQMMMSTVAAHGFCFYAKHISDVGSRLGFNNKVDLTSEMLDCTTNVMALGKLSRQDDTKYTSIYTKKQLEVNNPANDKRTSLVNVIGSIVPARSSLTLKGLALNEYVSSLRQISISEGFRISQGVAKTRKLRMRGSQHYLSRCRMKLSPEDISLVCEGDLYRKISSQYPANMESNCT